ncbi:MAG TPA: hypothetical protein VGH28_03125 [Polyangiaceae bacterium]
MLSIFATAWIVGCGGATPAPASTATTAQTTEPKPATTAIDANKPAESAKSGLTEEKLRAAKSLGEPFPEVDAVVKEVGPPTAQGTATRREWYFDKKASGKSLYCDTVDVIKSPRGKAIFDSSVYTSPECAKVSATSAKLLAVLDSLGSEGEKQVDSALDAVAKKNVSFDDVAGAFEKKLGKAQISGEPAFSAWKYTNEDGECRMLVLTSHLGSQASQAIWGVGCD